jgi:RNA polymerase sigma factor (sigma-70 family)
MARASTHPSLLDRLRDSADAEAWREFAERYRDLLLRYALQRGLAIHDAEDVVQASLARLSRSLVRFEYRPQIGTFRGYLRRVVENEVRRAEGRRRPELLPLEEGGDLLASESEELERIWRREWMDHHYRLALATVRAAVTPRTYAVFERLLAGEAPADVARGFGLSDDAVYKVKQRVRERLQQAIETQLKAEEFRERRA